MTSGTNAACADADDAAGANSARANAFESCSLIAPLGCCWRASASISEPPRNEPSPCWLSLHPWRWLPAWWAAPAGQEAAPGGGGPREWRLERLWRGRWLLGFGRERRDGGAASGLSGGSRRLRGRRGWHRIGRIGRIEQQRRHRRDSRHWSCDRRRGWNRWPRAELGVRLARRNRQRRRRWWAARRWTCSTART